MGESKTAPMLEQPGATPASNRGTDKDGRGRRTAVPIVSIILPNLKAKHRSTGDGINWKYEIHYIQNRWYAEYRPKYRKLMQRLKLRK